MVGGLDKCREYFAAHTEQYVLRMRYYYGRL